MIIVECDRFLFRELSLTQKKRIKARKNFFWFDSWAFAAASVFCVWEVREKWKKFICRRAWIDFSLFVLENATEERALIILMRDGRWRGNGGIKWENVFVRWKFVWENYQEVNWNLMKSFLGGFWRNEFSTRPGLYDLKSSVKFGVKYGEKFEVKSGVKFGVKSGVMSRLIFKTL